MFHCEKLDQLEVEGVEKLSCLGVMVRKARLMRGAEWWRRARAAWFELLKDDECGAAEGGALHLQWDDWGVEGVGKHREEFWVVGGDSS